MMRKWIDLCETKLGESDHYFSMRMATLLADALGADVQQIKPGSMVPWGRDYMGGLGFILTMPDGQRAFSDAAIEDGTVYLSQISVENPGNGSGTRIMEAIRKIATQRHYRVRVLKVTNHAFFDRFNWLTRSWDGSYTAVAPDVHPITETTMLGEQAGENVTTMTVWHATSPGVRVDKIIPFMHLGSKQAAMHRGKMYRTARLYEFEITVTKSLRCNDAIGAQHSVQGLVEWLETKLRLNDAIVDRLLMQCRADEAKGVPPSLAGGRAVAAVLRRRGYDFLWYENAVEDPGSVAWIVLDPSHVHLIGEAIPE